MTTAEFSRALIEYVAAAYVADVNGTYPSPELNQRSVMAQLVDVHCDSANNCGACVEQFLGPGVTELAVIKQVRDTLCASNCVCSVDVFQDMTVNFDPNVRIAPPSDEVVRRVAEQVNRQLRQRFGDEASVTEAQVRAMLTQSGAATVANQILLATQVVVLEGTGSLRNVNQSIMIDAVMAAIFENSSTAVSETLGSYVDRVRDFVTTQVDTTLGQELAKYSTLFIVLGSLLGASLLAWFVLYIIIARRR